MNKRLLLVIILLLLVGSVSAGLFPDRRLFFDIGEAVTYAVSFFDQVLNTTSNVTFFNVNISNDLCLGGVCFSSLASAVNDTYVPYVGANESVDLGDNNLSASWVNASVEADVGLIGGVYICDNGTATIMTRNKTLANNNGCDIT